MVAVNFKLTEAGRAEFPLPAPLSLHAVLEHCTALTGYTPGGYIAVRRGQVIAALDLLEDGDDVDIFPALSGG